MKSVLEVSECHGPGKAAEVNHIVEYQAGRRSLRRRPGWRPREAVPKTGGQHCGEDGQNEHITELLRPGTDGPAEAGDERQNTSIEENVELDKKRDRFSTGEPGQER